MAAASIGSLREFCRFRGREAPCLLCAFARTGSGRTAALVDRLDALLLEPGEVVLHVLELFGRMALPFHNFVEDAQRRP